MLMFLAKVLSFISVVIGVTMLGTIWAIPSGTLVVAAKVQEMQTIPYCLVVAGIPGTVGLMLAFFSRWNVMWNVMLLGVILTGMVGAMPMQDSNYRLAVRVAGPLLILTALGIAVFGSILDRRKSTQRS